MTMEPRRSLNIRVRQTLFDRDCIEANMSLQISSVSEKKEKQKKPEKISNKSTFPNRWNKIHRSREPKLSNISNVIRQWFYRSKCVWMILHQSLLSLRHLHNCRFFQYELDLFGASEFHQPSWKTRDEKETKHTSINTKHSPVNTK